MHSHVSWLVISACLFFQSFMALAEISLSTRPLLSSKKTQSLPVSCKAHLNPLEKLKEFGQEIDQWIGHVDACNQGPNNSFKMTCEKVKAADLSSFEAQFNFAAQPGDRGYVNCNPQNAPELVEALHLSDMAAASDRSLKCSTPFLNTYKNNPDSQLAKKLDDSAYQAFLKIQERLKSKKTFRDKNQDQVDLTTNSCGHGEDLKFPSAYCIQNRGRAQENKAVVNKLDLEMAVLINQIPYGSDERMRKKIIEIVNQPQISKEQFKSIYRPVVSEIADDYQSFQNELSATKKGDQYFLTPSLRARFLYSPTHDELYNTKPNLDPVVKDVMMCRSSREREGKDTYNKGILIGSILSVVATGGLSASGIALTGAARAAFVATDMALLGLDSGTMLGQIYDTCYKNISVVANGGACSPEQGLNAVIAKSSTAECATNVVLGAAVTGAVAVSAVSKIRPRSQMVDEVVEEAPITEIVVTGTRKKKKPASISEQIQSAEPKKIFSRNQFTSDNLNLAVTTERQNSRWAEIADLDPQPQGIRYLDTENAAVKLLNDTTLDKNFVTAMTNKHKQLVMEKIRALEAKYPDVEFIPYSDFKSFRYAFRPKPPLKELPSGFYSDIDKAFKQANSELSDLLKKNGLIDKFSDSREWFKAGYGETADEAADLSRYSRTAPDSNYVRTRDRIYTETRETDLKMAKLYGESIQSSMKGSNLLEETATAGKFIPKAEVFDAVRKTRTAEETQEFLFRTTGNQVSLADAKKLRTYTGMVDKFSPSLRITKRESSVLSGKHGGITIDLVGAGSKNLKETSRATAGAKEIDDVLLRARAGEKKVTELLDAKKLEVKETVMPILKKNGIEGRFLASGDDITIVPTNKPMSDSVKKEIADALAATKDPSSFRMGMVGTGIRTTQERMILATTMEDVVKKTVLKVDVSPEVRKKVFISAQTDTTIVGKGRVKLVIGGKVSPAVRKQYEQAFKKALEEINQKTKSKYSY